MASKSSLIQEGRFSTLTLAMLFTSIPAFRSTVTFSSFCAEAARCNAVHLLPCRIGVARRLVCKDLGQTVDSLGAAHCFCMHLAAHCFCVHLAGLRKLHGRHVNDYALCICTTTMSGPSPCCGLLSRACCLRQHTLQLLVHGLMRSPVEPFPACTSSLRTNVPSLRLDVKGRHVTN